MKQRVGNPRYAISIFWALLIVFNPFLTSYAEITPINERTSQVQDVIVAAVSGVDNASDVTDVHLTAITSLNLRAKGITALKSGDFSGLTALTNLNLYGNMLSGLHRIFPSNKIVIISQSYLR